MHANLKRIPIEKGMLYDNNAYMHCLLQIWIEYLSMIGKKKNWSVTLLVNVWGSFVNGHFQILLKMIGFIFIQLTSGESQKKINSSGLCDLFLFFFLLFCTYQVSGINSEGEGEGEEVHVGLLTVGRWSHIQCCFPA